MLQQNDCYSNPDKQDTIMLEAIVAGSRKTISVTLASYHRKSLLLFCCGYCCCFLYIYLFYGHSIKRVIMHVFQKIYLIGFANNALDYCLKLTPLVQKFLTVLQRCPLYTMSVFKRFHLIYLIVSLILLNVKRMTIQYNFDTLKCCLCYNVEGSIYLGYKRLVQFNF